MNYSQGFSTRGLTLSVEFVVKLQLEGHSRIGVHYSQEYQAVKTYEELISSPEDTRYSLSIELLKHQLNLSIVSELSGFKKHYQQLNYNSEQLKKLMIGLDLEKKFIFLHTYTKNNQLFVAKPFRSQLFIQLSSVEIINPNNI